MQQTQKNFEVQIRCPKEGRNAKHMYYSKEGTVKMRVTDGPKWPKLASLAKKNKKKKTCTLWYFQLLCVCQLLSRFFFFSLSFF